MHLTYREWWAVVHGMGLGALFLLAFARGLAVTRMAVLVVVGLVLTFPTFFQAFAPEE
jgi:hypothetical protein